MDCRFFSRFCLFFASFYLHLQLAYGGEFLIYHNKATAEALIEVYTKLANIGWGRVNFTGADIFATSADQGTRLGAALLNTPSYFTLQLYEAGSGTPEGLSALFEQLKSSTVYYIIRSKFDDQQGQILSNYNPPMFGDILFDNPEGFVGNRDVNQAFSIMDDKAAQKMINNTSDFSSVTAWKWANNNNQVTSAVVIEALTKAIANPPKELLGFNFSGSPGISDEIAPYLAELIKKSPIPQIFNFNFSFVSGENSNDLIAAVIENIPATMSGGLNSNFKFKHGNLTGFSETWWKFFLQNSNNLIFGYNKLGNSMQAFANAIKERPASTSLWLDLSSNEIDGEAATLLLEALGYYFETNHPTSAFYFAFGGNPLGDQGIDALVNFFNRFSVYVNDCPWNQVTFDDSQFSAENWIKLLDVLKTTDLSSITLKRANLSDPRVMRKLGELIAASPKLWYIDMSNASITDEGIAEFASAISNISQLPSYTLLRHNLIGDNGAKVLADSIKTVQVATNINLDLSHNKIGTDGAMALIGVNSEKQIASITLGGNLEIDVDSILPLFAHQSGAINLASMGLTDEQAVSLAQIIKNNPRYKDLIVYGNEIGDKGMLALGDAFVYSLQQVFASLPPHKNSRVNTSERFDRARMSYYKHRPTQSQVEEKKEETSVLTSSYFGNRCTVQ